MRFVIKGLRVRTSGRANVLASGDARPNMSGHLSESIPVYMAGRSEHRAGDGGMYYKSVRDKRLQTQEYARVG